MSVQHGTDPRVGVRFGSYVVERKLGEGGMGAVYAAVQPEIGKRVAIKFLAPELAADPQVVQRFFAEARAVNLIQHENIVDIFDFRNADGQAFFVMEFLGGASLGTVLSTFGSLPVARSLSIAVQVAAAISAAHAHGIVHRDLKPDNIYLTAKAGYEDFVKVLDFGIAKLQRPLGAGSMRPMTIRGQVMGTPGYMSPEQASGGQIDARTDVYALGVILYRMVGGRTPFDGRTFEELLSAQLGKKVPPLSAARPDAPPELVKLVQEMLEKDPGKRPQRMRDVQERLVDLLRAIQGVTPSGRMQAVSDGWRSVPPTRMPESRSRPIPIQRPRWPMLAAAVALAAAAGGVAFFLVRAQPAPAPAPEPIHTAAAPAAKSPAPASSAIPPVPIPTPAPAPTAPTGNFSVFVETTPPGVEVRVGGKLLGTTPVKLALDREQTLRLHKAGLRDEEVAVSAGTEHVLVPMERAGAPRRVERPSNVYQSPAGATPARKPPPNDDGTGLGLND
jgi:serine/threonine-protein kinase